ncbi:MAG: ABC transporter ATP-binding protein [Clostridia bacterium]|nr:ABC transporter ATP-binding protein [Clostridia bacterium]
MIEVKNLSKSYGDKKAVKSISFSVEKGEILGLLGPNGAGKSTTMNMITGYISMSGGSVTVNGVDVLENPMEAKKLIGYLPEQPPLYMDMTVWEYLNFVYELKKVKINITKKDHLNDVMNTVSILDVKDRKIKNLSKGYRQRVGFAQALIGKPEVLILDEPTVGLDPNQIVEIRDVIKSLRKEHTVIFSTHILSEASELCDRIAIVNNGSIAVIGKTDELLDASGMDVNIGFSVDKCEKDFADLVKKIPDVTNVIKIGSSDFEVKAKRDVTNSILKLCKDNSIFVMSLKTNVPTLETMFVKLTEMGGM